MSKATPFWMRHWRLFFLIALLLAAAVAYRQTALREYLSPEGLERLRADILATGWRGMSVFFCLYVLFMTFGLPNLPFQLAGGAIYGVAIAFPLMYLGVNIGAVSSMFLARYLGRKGIEELFGHRLTELNQRIERGGFRLVLILRLIPLMPFNAVNYASGLSRLRLRDYVLANMLGMLPLTFLHVLFGSGAGEITLSEPKTWLNAKLVLPLAGAALMLATALIFSYRQLKAKPPSRH